MLHHHSAGVAILHLSGSKLTKKKCLLLDKKIFGLGFWKIYI
jgi:hypothetical protein